MLDARTRGSFIYFVRRIVTANVGCRFSIDSGSAKPTVKSDQLVTAWPHEAGSGKPKIEFRATADKFPWAPILWEANSWDQLGLKPELVIRYKNHPVLQEQNILRLSKTI